MLPNATNDEAFAILNKRTRDGQVNIRFNWHVVIAVVLSLLIHGLLLWKVVFPPASAQRASPRQPSTINIVLAPPQTPAPEVKTVPNKVESVPKKVKRKPKPIKKPVVQAKKNVKKIKQKRQQPKKQATVVNTVAPPITPSPQQTIEKPAETQVDTAEVIPKYMDMSDYIAMKQKQRNKSEYYAAQANAAYRERQRPLSEEEKRDARIKNNLKVGTNGLFQIIRMDALGASFSFRGWTNDYSAARMQYFDVPAEAGKSTKRLVVQRMIKLIRTHYDGDFKWESPRLGRVITLSARQEDNAGLEEFLMREFF